MITKKVVYEDYLGNKREEELFFHMTDHELTMFVTTEGGYTLDKVMERLVRDRNVKNLLKIIEEIIDKSYGCPSPDGRRFEKSPEILANFKQTEAYSQVFMELMGDEMAAVNFIKGIVSKNTLKKMEDQISTNPELASQAALLQKSSTKPNYHQGMEVTAIGSSN